MLQVYSIVIQYFYSLYSIESYSKTLTIILCVVQYVLLLIYFIQSSLYLLMLYSYLENEGVSCSVLHSSL